MCPRHQVLVVLLFGALSLCLAASSSAESIRPEVSVWASCDTCNHSSGIGHTTSVNDMTGVSSMSLSYDYETTRMAKSADVLCTGGGGLEAGIHARAGAQLYDPTTSATQRADGYIKWPFILARAKGVSVDGEPLAVAYRTHISGSGRVEAMLFGGYIKEGCECRGLPEGGHECREWAWTYTGSGWDGWQTGWEEKPDPYERDDRVMFCYSFPVNVWRSLELTAEVVASTAHTESTRFSQAVIDPYLYAPTTGLPVYLVKSLNDTTPVLMQSGTVLFGDFSDATTAPVGDPRTSIGVAWGDYDNDGDPDLYLSNFGPANTLFRNDGNGAFTDVTAQSLVGVTGNSTSVAWGDYNNDGYLDLYVGGYDQANTLFQNDGDGTFTDVTDASGLSGVVGGGPWGDYDNDGYLDLYVSGQPSRLFRNTGSGTFVDVTAQSLVGDEGNCAWVDYDNDGDLDISLWGDSLQNSLFRNNGDGTFGDVTGASGLLTPVGTCSGARWGDYDNDGDLDAYVVYYDEPSWLYRNNGDGTFTDVTALAGALGGSSLANNATWGDYDNDGALDLYVVNEGEANTLFRNNGDGQFEDVTAQCGPLGDESYGWAAGWADYDGDGDLDLYLANDGHANKLFRNVIGAANHWLGVKLDGTASNRNGIGAQVIVEAGGERRIQHMLGDQNCGVVHFGLGAASYADSLIVLWPSGTRQAVVPPSANRVVTVTESDEPVEYMFVQATSALGDVRNCGSMVWGDYDDDGDLDLFAAGDLVPNRLLRNNGNGSSFVNVATGPLASAPETSGAAWGDYDNDGDLDLCLNSEFLNYSVSPPSGRRLLRNDGVGGFVDVTSDSLTLPFPGVSYGVAWGDYDNDGDLDLCVGPRRLLRNDGGDTFTFSGFVPDYYVWSQLFGAIMWVDYDNDVDVDLQWGSVLYRNDGGGTFVDVTAESQYPPPPPYVFPGDSAGLAWGDYDNDGDIDLYACEGGPWYEWPYCVSESTLWRNNGEGAFEDVTDSSGPVELRWPVPEGTENCSALGATWVDYDNDGYKDLYVATSCPWNLLFRNEGNGTFSSVTDAGGPLGGDWQATGASWADYDGDGALDLCLANFFERSMLFRNEIGTDNNWLDVKLEGLESNESGIGARIRVVSGALRQVQEVSSAARTVSQNLIPAHFGLGSAAAVDSLTVRWPSGFTQVVLPPPAVNAVVTVAECGRLFVDTTAGPLGDDAGTNGVAWGDYDGDGDLDLYIANGEEPSKLFRNNGVGGFADVTSTSGPIGGSGQDNAIAWGDYDNDGDLDMYVARLDGPSRLFQNNGSGVFSDVTTASGLDVASGIGHAGAWGDYDNDGDLDLYKIRPSVLFRNEGDGTFADATTAPLVVPGSVKCAVWGDYDDDRDLDLFVTVGDGVNPNRLIRNDGGGAFSDATTDLLAVAGGSCMGAAWGDYDNDCDLDLFVANWGEEGWSQPNRLFRNEGGGVFSDATSEPLADPTGSAEGVAWGDYDNDGDLDLYLLRWDQPNKLFRNDGGGAFVDASLCPQDDTGSSVSAAWGDYDGDGGLDLYLGNRGQANRLFRNSRSSSNHWLSVKLQATISNRDGIGARVYVLAGGTRRMQEVSGVGLYSQSSTPVWFGLGAAATVDSLIVLWPSGLRQAVARPAVDTAVTVTEIVGQFTDATTGPLGDTGNGTGVAWGDYDNDGDLDLYLAKSGQANKLFRNDGAGTFVDVTSSSGPVGNTGNGRGVAWGDYDNDGDIDLYLVNHGGTNKLFRNNGTGTFSDVTTTPLADSGQYGTAAAWGDYDNDGDIDLYVANLGYADRLLRNDGGTTFVVVTGGPLGDTGQGNAVAWGDYDNDGDLDLYLAKGTGQANRLLRNDGVDTFVDVTSSSGPLGDVGNSRGVAWGDYDSDGDLDLYVANSGQPNRLFRNEGDGTFADATSGPLGNSDSTQGVAWGDYDNDGRLDLYVVNDGQANRLIRNAGGGVFADVTSALLGDTGSGRGVTWGDYDGDGDLDLYVANWGQANRLLRNDAGSGNNWLQVKLTGTWSNRSGIGARVYVEAGGKRQMQEVSGGSGLYSQDSLPVEFGLGSSTAIDSLIVLWPSRIRQVVPSPAVNSVVTVTETDAHPSFADATSGPLGDTGASWGVAWGDYDNDGDPDLYVTQLCTANMLFRNDGGGTFVDVTTSSGPIGDEGCSTGAAWGDYDNDGNLDLYVANDGEANKLFRNLGNGVFDDVTASSGPVGDVGYGYGVGWGDYDNDGHLDLFLANSAEAGNKLFRNLGDGTFADVTVASGPIAGAGYGEGVAWGDYDSDGDLDLYVVSSVGQTSQLFRNEGNATFADVTSTCGLSVVSDAAGAAWSDYDNDGDLDLDVCGLGGNLLFRNSGDGTFLDATSGSGVIASGTMGVAWGDYNNDGNPDLYLSRSIGPNTLFRSNGDGTFTDATKPPLGDAGDNRGGLAWGDYDSDGDLDLYIANNYSANKLLRNEVGSTNNWVQVKLVGTESNRSGIGARVHVVAGTVRQMQEVSGGSGRFSQNSLPLEFGLGSSTAIDSLIVQWPSGIRQVVPPPAINAIVTVEEGRATYFADAASGGPLGNAGTSNGVAWGDYDNDGDQDLYVANYGEANNLFQNDGDGTFTDVTSGPLGDMGNGLGAAWGDFDNDGDLDLYVANEGEANRLFRNDGDGTFTDVTDSSGAAGDPGGGSGIAWGDYDRDGNIDLYVARFGAPNKLYRNLGTGAFADVTATSGPVGDAGEGDGVAWADYDNDGDLDLFLANYDGGTNRLFQNLGNATFTDATEASGVAGTGTGSGAAWGDYDNDGDLDLYVSNWGEANSLFRNNGDGTFTDIASVSGPIADVGMGQAVAWGDYDNDGHLDLYLVNCQQANKLFHNEGGVTFTDATASPLDDTGYGPGVAMADYDNDGDLDIYLANAFEPNRLFRNDLNTGNNWLHVDLVAIGLGRGVPSVIGARVYVEAGGVRQMREVSGGSGLFSQDSLPVEFGLGASTTIDSLIVEWPSGERQVVPPPAVNTVATVTAVPPSPTVAVGVENLDNDHFEDYAKDGDDLVLTATVGVAYGSLDELTVRADLSGLLDGGGDAVAPDTYVGCGGVATWNLSDVALGEDGPAEVTVSAAGPLGNTGNGSATVTVDNTAPGAVTGFSASPGHNEVVLAWTNPLDGDLHEVVIRGALWGDYPYYATSDPEYPADPAAGVEVWHGTETTTTVLYADDESQRDICSFQAFARDKAMNYGPAATTARDRATNYWLGDVAKYVGGDLLLGGDGFVFDADIIGLSSTYTGGAPVGQYGPHCDVGPTDDHSRLGIPLTDELIDFEDLVIFAMSYDVASPRVVPFLAAPSGGGLSLSLVELSRSPEDEVQVALRLEGNVDEVKGLSTVITFDPAELEFVSAGLSDAMASPLAETFFWSSGGDGTVQVDLAVLGTGVTIGGSGDVSVLTFQALSGAYALEFDDAVLRGVENEDLGAKLEGLESQPQVPTAFRLAQNVPNPFNPVTTIRYDLPVACEVRLEVYDATGRLVRVLRDGVVEQAASRMTVWDGTDDGGRPVASGVYFYRLEAGEFTETRSMVLLK